MILYSFLLSFAIELIQEITLIGLFEIDDVIHNTLGASVGFFCLSFLCID